MSGGSKKIPFTPEQIGEMRRLYMEEGESMAFIAKKFGVSQIVIRNRLDATIQLVNPPKKHEKPVKIIEEKPKPKRRIIGVNI